MDTIRKTIRTSASLLALLALAFLAVAWAQGHPQMADPAYHAPAPNPVAEQRARLNTFARPGRGGAATAAAPASDGWEEF